MGNMSYEYYCPYKLAPGYTEDRGLSDQRSTVRIFKHAQQSTHRTFKDALPPRPRSPPGPR